MDKQPSRPWLTVKDAADYAQVSEDWIRRRIYRNEIEAINISSKKAPRWRIPFVGLEEYLYGRRSV